ncbi:MAG: MBL fold metallo-hydrolase [Dermatophilaceae bacterium]
MLTLGFPAAAFDTNCFILARQAGEECLIVDPGIGVVDQLREVLQQFRLRPGAVLLTHGHLDHVFSVTPVCASGGVAAYIHAADRQRLKDPFGGLEPMMMHMFESEFGPKSSWQEPDDVLELGADATLTIAGMTMGTVHAPGHTAGSVMFCFDDTPDGINAEVASTVVAGDVLFAGSIGRCDLPGGDEAAMMRSLRDTILPMPDDRLVLPGHGPLTTIGIERDSNPFLRNLR